MPSPPSNVDSLREKLRGLGYLDAGVDRFVLAPARSGRGMWSIAWRASLRVGFLTALLVGVPATAAVALRLPTLLTGPRDAMVLLLYFGGVAALATSLVTLAVTLAAARVARVWERDPRFAHRAQRLARLAGVLVAVLCLAYLTLWWNAVAGVQRPALGATGLALLVAASVALLLGHTTMVVALAVLVRPGAGADSGRLGQPSWRFRLAAALAAATASVAVFAVAPGAAPDRKAPPLVVVPTGLRLLVIAVDGFDPRFAATISRSKNLAALQRVLAAPHVELPRSPEWDPVAVWMSMATAQPPERHRALGLESRRLAGVEGRLPGSGGTLGRTLAATTDLLRLTRPEVSSGAERVEPAFWEVAAAAGLRTATINWWTTWPASPRDGIVLTERAALRLDRGGQLQGEISPAALYERLRLKWPEMKAGTAQRARRVAAGLDPDVANLIARAAEIDDTQVAFARSLDPERLDLLTVYLPGLDIAQAGLFADARPLTASSLATALTALERLYGELDTLVTELTSAAPTHTLVVVTHPGRVRDEVPALLSMPDLTGAASGPAHAVTTARLEDVGATILPLLGLPLSRTLAGQPRTELFPRALLAQFPPRHIERYAAREIRADSAARTSADTLDTEARERLRSLGYVR